MSEYISGIQNSPKGKIILTGEIRQINFRNSENWSTGTLRVDNECRKALNGDAPASLQSSRLISFTGVTTLNAGQRAALRGSFQKHNKYGMQFVAEVAEQDTSIGTGGLAVYITNHPELKGIGPVKSKKLVDKFGENLEEICLNSPEKLTVKPFSLKRETITQLHEVLSQDRVLRDIKFWLADLGLTHKQIIKLTEQYGWRTKQILEENPYQMIDDLDNFGFFRVDQIAKKMKVPEDSPCRMAAGVLYQLSLDIKDGHCWTAFEQLVKSSNETLALNSISARQDIRNTIFELVEDGKLINSSDCIALPDIYQKENDVLEAIKAYHGVKNRHLSNVKNIESLIPPELNEDQQTAFRSMIENQVSLITGGAGVGKTYLIKSIATAYQQNGFSVTCAALAGKAAQRITESTGFPADTIHKTLLCDGFSWGYDRNNKLITDVLIIDEVSMIDVYLFWRVFEAIDLEKTALILVGDYNQLPPVGPGNLLRDLVSASQNVISHSVLNKCVRQAGTLKHNSNLILEGIVQPTTQPDPSEATKPVSWYVFDSFIKPDKGVKFIEDIYNNYIEDSFGYDLINDVQLVTPIHKGDLGVENLNVVLQGIIQRKLYSREVPPDFVGRPVVGDKVIQTKNDRKSGLLNGMIGVVSNADRLPKDSKPNLTKPRSRSIYIRWEDGIERKATPGDQKNIQLAYALTIHKMQGSQVPCVIAVCHRSQFKMLYKNLLYTAVTRSSERMILIGDRQGIRIASQNEESIKRRTWSSILANR